MRSREEILTEALTRVDARWARRRRLSVVMQLVGAALVALGFGIAALGCPKPPAPPPVTPDAADAAPPAPPPPVATCDEACANVRRLGCEGAAACPRVCSRIVDPAYRTRVARARSCADVSAADEE